ncbi:hypothetical protein NP493_290g00002 [Ridgeia piscesae]|uniref:Uncharacterized protein n=1 Tax=Ridgeia piscesae TaxID=27915 RepID=A0AAD9NWV6_RIDPI|nr:hypothetical protein NP493_290g00002 [Ridgeia piscesae]
MFPCILCASYFKKKTRSLAYLNHPQSLSHSRQCRYASLLKRFSVDPVIGTMRHEWREDCRTDTLPPRRYERSWLPRFDVVHELPTTQFEPATENLQETSLFDATATAVSETVMPARALPSCGTDAGYRGAGSEELRTCSADVETPLCVCADLGGHRRASWDNEASDDPS